MKRRYRSNSNSNNNALLSSLLFKILLLMVLLALLLSTFLYFEIDHGGVGASHKSIFISSDNSNNNRRRNSKIDDGEEEEEEEAQPPHLFPRLPYLPAFPKINNSKELIHRTLYENQPTIAGIAALLNQFITELHNSNQQQAEDLANPNEILETYFRLASKYLVPLDVAYRYRPFFPIRNDDSIFVSVAAYREHLLADTLISMYDNAKNPNKLFVGVIVNNCFQTDGSCKAGVKVVGKNKQGRDILQQVNGIPDRNHIETFCRNSTYQPYCDAGQVRVLYVHETEALGPAVARYYSSKLWGGETYYVQIDSHLHFAKGWDELYISDLKLCSSFPKAILSTYPPGFVNFRQNPPYTPGTRLCRCQLRSMEGYLPRVEMEGRCKENEPKPTQMPFVGAGFFFARADLLVDCPFDPFLPWMFMGEEIALSIRLWTSGWNIYAPRKNLIGHQYRPIKMGNPHYQDSVARLFQHRPALVNIAQEHVRNRIKYMMGYPSIDKIRIPNFVLTALDTYGVGKVRKTKDYLQFAEIDLDHMTCGSMEWCAQGTLE